MQNGGNMTDPVDSVAANFSSCSTSWLGFSSETIKEIFL